MKLSQVTLLTLVQFIGRAISLFSGFLITVLIARAFGTAILGNFSKVMSFVGLFFFGIDFGLNPVFLRREHTSLEKQLSSFWTMRLVMAALLILVCVFSVVTLQYTSPGYDSEMVGGVLIASILIFNWAIQQTMLVWFQQKKKFATAALIQSVGAIVAVFATGGVSLYFSHASVPLAWLLIGASVIGSTITSLFLTLFVSRVQPLTLKIDSERWQEWLKESLPLGVVLFLNIIYFRADIVIMTAFRSAGEIGEYSLAYKFFEAAIIFPTLFMNSVYPDILKQSEVGERLKSFKKIFVFLSFFGTIVGLLFFLFSPLLLVIRSDVFLSVKLLRFLSVGIPLFFVTSPIMWLYITLNEQKRLMVVYGVSLALNIILNLLLVPIYGALACAVITTVCEGGVLLMAASGISVIFKENSIKSTARSDV